MEPAPITISIDGDKACAECGTMGAAPCGLCLACLAKQTDVRALAAHKRREAEMAVNDRNDILVRAIELAADKAAEAIRTDAGLILAAVREELMDKAEAEKALKASFRVSIVIDLDNDPCFIDAKTGFGKAKSRSHLAKIEVPA